MQPFADLTVFNSNPWYRGVYEQVEGVKMYELDLFSRKWNFPFNLPAYAWWERQSFQFAKKLPRPDLIWIHGTAQRGKWVSRLAEFWGVPLVITEHTGPWSAIASRTAVLHRVKKIMEKADLVMPVSRHLEREIRESGIHPKKMAVHGNPVDTEFFALRSKPLTDPRRILFLGRLDPFKGGLRTLKAFHSIAAAHPSYRLTIAGDGAEGDEIENFIAENQLESQVEFLRKQLTREEMRSLFHDSSFLVFPSEFESFGLVAAEAMATGLPVVITDRTGPVDFSDENNSIPVDPLNPEEGIREMINSLHRYDPAQIRDGVERKFGISNWSVSLEKTLRPLLK